MTRSTELHRRTEGWPAGLYLAALDHQGGQSERRTGALTFTGDDVFMHDYLRSELLDRLPAAHVSFLTRTSALERMSGPLCDAVLEERARPGCWPSWRGQICS